MKKKSNKIALCREDRILSAVVNTVMVILLIIVLYPLIYVLSSSFSSGNAVSSGKVLLWPVEPSILGYRIVFSYRTVWTGYMNTIIYTVVGTAISIVLTVMAAYPLSRKGFQGRKFYTTIFMITMFFSGGMIPTYILMTKLGPNQTRWAVILSGALSVYNTIIMRTFFQNSIPQDLFDAARIDGINDFGYLFKIVMPLSKSVFSVILLYYAVAKWNSYFTAMLYLRERDMFPLQLILRDILSAAKISLADLQDAELLAAMKGASDVMKYSLIVVAALPVLVAYPFVQKYFEKGVMIGSVKG